MPYDGNGNYSPPSPAYPAVSSTIIYATDFNQIISDTAAALSSCLLVDGQAGVIADISMGGNKIQNLAAGTLPGDAVNVLQAFTDPHVATTTAVGLEITGTAVTLSVSAVDATATTLFKLPANSKVNLPSGLSDVVGRAGMTGALDFSTADVHVPTKAPGTVGDYAASVDFATQLAFTAALPVQTGKIGGVPSTNGTTTYWAEVIRTVNAASVTAVHGETLDLVYAGDVVVTLPTLVNGAHAVTILNSNGRATNTIDLAGASLVGLTGTLTGIVTLDTPNLNISLRASGGAWRIL